MKIAVLAACLISLCAGAYAKPRPALQTAKVISQNIGSYNGGTAVMPIGTALVGVPITRRSNIVVLETPRHRLTLQEAGNDRHLIVLIVNAPVQFFQDGNWIVILDSAGKKHKFGLQHAEALDPAEAPQK